jgi:hypothetical protein
VEKIAAEKLETPEDTVVLLFTELQILKDVEVQMDEALGFIAGVRKFSFGEGTRDGEQTISDALHCGNHDDDVGILRGLADQASGVQHSISAEK